MKDPYVCSDCGRDKAITLQDVLAGKCPKWWAPRDGAAHSDCKNFSLKTGPYTPAPQPRELGP